MNLPGLEVSFQLILRLTAIYQGNREGIRRFDGEREIRGGIGKEKGVLMGVGVGGKDIPRKAYLPGE